MSWRPKALGLPEKLNDLLRSCANNEGHPGCTVAEYIDEAANGVIDDMSTPEEVNNFIQECLDMLVSTAMSISESLSQTAGRVS